MLPSLQYKAVLMKPAVTGCAALGIVGWHEPWSDTDL